LKLSGVFFCPRGSAAPNYRFQITDFKTNIGLQICNPLFAKSLQFYNP